MFTRSSVSVQFVALPFDPAWVKATGQRAWLPLMAQAWSLDWVTPSNMDENRSPSIRGGESLILAEKRACAAAASARSLFKPAERYGASRARPVLSGIPSEG